MSTRPYFWYGYITYWFSMFEPLRGSFWISPDTIAIVMNFLSGPFVLLVGLGLLQESFDIADQVWNRKVDKNIRQAIFLSGWWWLLLWLTSGMGAFLVFVDNKTDLGVLLLTMIAIYSWFVFIKAILAQWDDELVDKRISINAIKSWFQWDVFKYLTISAVFFAFATMAKPTAFFDVTNFAFVMIVLGVGFFSVVGMFLGLMWVLAMVEFRGIEDYMSSDTWVGLFVLGTVVTLLDSARAFLQKKIQYVLYLGAWVVVLTLTLIVFKLPYIVAMDISFDQWKSIGDYIHDMFLAWEDFQQDWIDNWKDIDKDDTHMIDRLLVSTNSVQDLTTPDEVQNHIEASQCRDKSFGTGELYENTREAIWDTRSEDVGRYVWYGYKPWYVLESEGGVIEAVEKSELPSFQDPWWWFVFPLGDEDIRCFGFDEAANKLCENLEVIQDTDISKTKGILESIPDDSEWYELLINALGQTGNLSSIEDDEQVLNQYANKVDDIIDYVEENSIMVVRSCVAHPDTEVDEKCNVYNNENMPVWKIEYGKDIYVPYRYLTPFNMTFNRSLQNLSSYYTDVGFVWLIGIWLIMIWAVYSLMVKDKFLKAVSFSTLSLWVLWWLIAGGILWYGLGIVVWTILAINLFWYRLFSQKVDSKYENKTNILLGAVVVLMVLFGGFQLVLNFVRIHSQWWGEWPFMWYRQWVGKINDIDVDFTRRQPVLPEDETKIPYRYENVFDQQFGHYDEFIERVNNRKEDERLFLAGTYARYFLNNQYNIEYDQFVTWLWEQFSDGDVCKSYWRLKDNDIKYITIDPNIGTVVMGWGNESLFHRFFGEIDRRSWELVQDGAMSMIAKMYSRWYVEYIDTNNLGIKYALTLSDGELESVLDRLIVDDIQIDQEDLDTIRAGLMWARYPWVMEMTQDYFGFQEGIVDLIVNIAMSRVDSGELIYDMAAIQWLDVDEDSLATTLRAYDSLASSEASAWFVNTLQEYVETLNKDERLVLLNFLGLLESPDPSQQVTQTVMQSLQNSSQIFTVEVK